MLMVSSVQYFVLLNGSPWGNIMTGKGLRQGNPLSPYLFIMGAKVLGRSFYKLADSSCIKGVKPATNAEVEVIQQFVDDTFLFGESSIMEAEAWKIILHNYEEILGQRVNYHKSKIYFFNTDPSLQRRIRKILDCQTACLLDTYLGLPLTTKEVSNEFWNLIVERIQKKLAGWKGKILNNAGKLQLIAAALQGIPIYFLSIFKINLNMVKKIERIQRNFLWSGTEEKNKLNLVNWEKVCKPKAKGGLGLEE